MTKRLTKRLAILFLAAAGFLFSPTAWSEPGPTLVAHGAASDEVSGLLRAYPAGGEGLAIGVTDLLTRDPGAAASIALQSKKINCDQAAAVALGVSRAISASKRLDREKVKKIYQPFEQACNRCGRRARDGRETANEAGREEENRLCRREEARDFADPNRIGNARGEDCLCSLIAALAAQIYAQGDAGERMGFFADELSGNGGAGGIGRWLGIPVSDN